MELFEAFDQWRTRPAEERFWNFQEMLTAALDLKLKSETILAEPEQLSFSPGNNDNLVLSASNESLTLSNWAFEQVCTTVQAPANFLTELSLDLAAKCLQERLVKAAPKSGFQLLSYRDSLRAFTSQAYARVWDADIIRKLIQYTSGTNWRTPPARPSVDDPRTRVATEEDVLLHSNSPAGLNIKAGDKIAPAGLYLSDRDMFIFMVDDKNPIEPGDGQSLCRGWFLSHSEVRSGKFSFKRFLFNGVCGNHIVWEASDVKEISWHHRGGIEDRVFESLETTFTEYSNASTAPTVAQIKKAKAFYLGESEEEVVDYLFRKVFTRTTVSQKFLKRSYELAVQFEHQSKAVPTSAWGFLDGATRASQELTHTNNRNRVDQIVAARVMELVG